MTKKYKGFRLAEELIDSYKLLSDEELEKEADRLMFLVDKYGEFSEFATQHTNAEAEITRRREAA